MRNLISFYYAKVSTIIIALLLVLLYALILFWNALGFLTSINFFVVNSFLLSLFIIPFLIYIIYKFNIIADVKTVVFNFIYFFILLIVICFISIVFWDNSFDGQTYHLQTVHELSKGWNPFKFFLPPSVPNSIFINHYDKAFEIFGNSIFQLTGDFETCKTSNLILFFAALMLSFAYLKKLLANKQKKAFIYSLLLVFNPVISTQIFTHLFDCQIALLFILLVFSFLFHLQNEKWAVIVWSSAIIILSSLKFTGLVYASMVTFFACCYLLYRQYKNGVKLTRFMFASFFAILFSIVFISANPYYTNLAAGKHIFYPLMGKNAVNIMTGTNAPESFEYKNRFQKFFIANTATSSNIHGNKVAPEPVFKLPFKVSLKEWTVFKSAGVLYGGMGPLFFGIMILAVFILGYLLWFATCFRKEFIFLCLFIMLSIFIIPECWLPRYVPQLWYIPILVLLFYEIQIKKTLPIKIISRFAYYLVGANAVIIFIVSVMSNIIITLQQKNEYKWLKNTHADVKLISNDFISTEYRLNKYGITYQEINNADTVMLASSLIFKPISSSSILLLPQNTTPYIPGDFFKFLESHVKANK